MAPPWAGLGGCAGPQVADYAAEQPRLDLRRYFDGPIEAHGMFQDRGGQVVKRFTVRMEGRWEASRACSTSISSIRTARASAASGA